MARSSSASSWISTRASRPSSTASACRSVSSASSRAATIRSTASAPISAGVAHVPRVDREVLPQHGHRDGRPRRHQVGGGTSEPGLVRQDRQARRAPSLVGRRQGGGIEVGGQVALRRRASLHLGDDRQLGRRRSTERRGEAPSGCGRARRLEEGLEGPGVGPRRPRGGPRGSGRGRWPPARACSEGQVLGLDGRQQVHLRRLGEQRSQRAEHLPEGRVLAVGVEGGLVGVDLVEPERPAVALAVEDVLDRAGFVCRLRPPTVGAPSRRPRRRRVER